MKDYKKIIFGLSIAVTCIASICIIMALIGIIYTILGFSALENNELISNIANDIKLGYETIVNGQDLIIGKTSIAIKDLLSLGLGFILTVAIFVFLCSAFTLFAGIYGIKKSNFRNIFIFDVIAAVLSLLSLNFINLVLLIICAIFAHKAQNPSQDQLKDL